VIPLTGPPCGPYALDVVDDSRAAPSHARFCILLGLIVLIFAPFIDKNPSNKPEDRKFAISLMTVHIMFWSVLVIIGSFFRGPGFNFTLPWRDGLFFDL